MTNVTKTANEYFLTQAQFDAKKQAGTLEVGAVYHITDVHSQDMFIKVYTTTTMNTSTLPTIAVPALTAQQVATIQTAASQGKEVTIDATHNGITNQLKVLESDHDGSVGGIRVTYYNNYVDYTLDGNQVTATYTPIGGAGGSLYFHKISVFDGSGSTFTFSVITSKEDAYESFDELASMLDIIQDQIGIYYDADERKKSIVFMAVISFADQEIILLTSDGSLIVDWFIPGVSDTVIEL